MPYRWRKNWDSPRSTPTKALMLFLKGMFRFRHAGMYTKELTK